ncbi:hypothetical protein DI270_010385 [Microbispora triticiradicis]|uniref:Uncharacterized protein n=1 Tax=Microbispora triticiradicis TaxID=2200763 RepID=A0ABX9LND0_9ACTN|nr:hypothetical protein DI270_010385 [Microbispora triticiradicis]
MSTSRRSSATSRSSSSSRRGAGGPDRRGLPWLSHLATSSWRQTSWSPTPSTVPAIRCTTSARSASSRAATSHMTSYAPIVWAAKVT